MAVILIPFYEETPETKVSDWPKNIRRLKSNFQTHHNSFQNKQLLSVLASCGCHDKSPQTGGLKTRKLPLSQF